MLQKGAIIAVLLVLSFGQNLAVAQDHCTENDILCLTLKINSMATKPIPRVSSAIKFSQDRKVKHASECQITEIFNAATSTCACDDINGWSRNMKSNQCVLNKAETMASCGFGYKFSHGSCVVDRFARLVAYCKRRDGLWIGNACHTVSKLAIKQDLIEEAKSVKTLTSPDKPLHLAQH